MPKSDVLIHQNSLLGGRETKHKSDQVIEWGGLTYSVQKYSIHGWARIYSMVLSTDIDALAFLESNLRGLRIDLRTCELTSGISDVI